MEKERINYVEVAYQQREGHRIRCEICPHRCKLDEGDIGICGGRQVIDGRLLATNYGQVCSLQLDPIEKKPLFHFYPGSEILSVGPNGCSLRCEWCQNWQIAQNTAPTRMIMPEELTDMVDALDGIGVAYTYAEPLIWFEYVRDAGRLMHRRGLMNVFITNGYVNPEPFKEILAIADAFNIDIKSHDDKCYRNYCGGDLSDVQRTIRMVIEAGKHLELTHLLVSGINDDPKAVEKVVDWIAAIDQDIPFHISRYFPANRYDEPATDIDKIKMAFEIARDKLKWVYLGNVWLEQGESSNCPKCGAMLVERIGMDIRIAGLNGGNCKSCGTEVNFRADPLL